MEANRGHTTYIKFHNSFSKVYDNKSSIATAFRCTPSSPDINTTPILPSEDRADYEKESEYSKILFDPAFSKPVSMDINTDKTDSIIPDSASSAENAPLHVQSKQYESVQQATASISLEDFANATFTSLSDNQRELLSWHNRLGHISFSDLNHLASSGTIPRRLVDTPAPKCIACLVGRSHRRPWRAKGK